MFASIATRDSNGHSRLHFGEKPYACSECDYAQKGDLENHAKLYAGEKPFRCGECNKTFKSSFFNVEKHLKRVHSEVNDYVNNVENDGAGQPTGEKPYRCSMCDKRFGLISSLETHGREKSFPCTDRLESHSSQPYGFSHMCTLQTTIQVPFL